MTLPRALVIDDDNGVRALLASLLEASGYQPTSAADGSRGLALFAPGHYTLLVTDLVMPGISGWDVAAAVRRDDPLIGIIIVTAADTTSDFDRVQALRAVVLAKPFWLEEFRAAVAAVVHGPVALVTPPGSKREHPMADF